MDAVDAWKSNRCPRIGNNAKVSKSKRKKRVLVEGIAHVKKEGA